MLTMWIAWGVLWKSPGDQWEWGIISRVIAGRRPPQSTPLFSLMSVMKSATKRAKFRGPNYHRPLLFRWLLLSGISTNFHLFWSTKLLIQLCSEAEFDLRGEKLSNPSVFLKKSLPAATECIILLQFIFNHELFSPVASSYALHARAFLTRPTAPRIHAYYVLNLARSVLATFSYFFKKIH